MSTFSYDRDTHILSIRFSKKKSIDSDIQDNVVIDYDKEGKVVNIDIMETSLSDFQKVEPVYALLANHHTQNAQR